MIFNKNKMIKNNLKWLKKFKDNLILLKIKIKLVFNKNLKLLLLNLNLLYNIWEILKLL
jgi:hypothetical protein